jgi:hypothetical protein
MEKPMIGAVRNEGNTGSVPLRSRPLRELRGNCDYGGGSTELPPLHGLDCGPKDAGARPRSVEVFIATVYFLDYWPPHDESPEGGNDASEVPSDVDNVGGSHASKHAHLDDEELDQSLHGTGGPGACCVPGLVEVDSPASAAKARDDFVDVGMTCLAFNRCL